jgi:low temperature requirement protein LtrA
MSKAGRPSRLLRPREAHGHARVTNVELFFDLVFVFAVTQLSHHLLKNLTPMGTLHTCLLFVAVWWVWIYTSWVTNWLDPERTPVRLLLFGLMLAGLVLATSIPQAFGARGLQFAAAYVAMQVGRSLFTLWALGAASPSNRRSYQRITVWFAASGVFWLAGGLVYDNARFALWAIAFAVEFVAPSLGYFVPGLGRSRTGEWDIEGNHLAERCLLFIIIALGESLLVTGATFAELAWNPATILAFVLAFIATVAMWWVYFDTGAVRGSQAIARSDNPGRLGRLAYTYFHLPIVAGIVVSAVADELVLAHATGHTELAVALSLLGGPALFLIGNLLFKGCFANRPPLSHLVGLGLLVVLAPASLVLPPVGLGAGAVVVLVVVAIWETRSRRRHSAPAAAV